MSQLPSNSTSFERALDEALDEFALIGPAIDSIKGVKYARPLNVTVGPWLIQEYGLGPISQFFDDTTGLPTGLLLSLTSPVVTDTAIEKVIDQGRPWQRIRGTRAAIEMALEWIDYEDITIFDRVLRRRRWHLYQIEMGELPFPDEDSRLRDAEYLADLSDPARSFFWRGYHGYDVRSHVWGRSRYGRSIWGDSSGVRINGGKTQWSHGRQHDVDVELTDEVRLALGLTYETGDEVSWDENLSWDTDGVSWMGIQSAPMALAWAIGNTSPFVALYSNPDEIVGVISILRPPQEDVASEELTLTFDARTGFGDGAGSVVTQISLCFNAVRSEDVKPFKRWLLPDQVDLSGAIEIMIDIDPFKMGKTVREFFKVAMPLGSVAPIIDVPPDPPEGFLLTNDELELLFKDENGDFLTTSED